MRAFPVLLAVAAFLFSCTSASPTDDPEKVKSELAAVERRLIMAVQRKDLATLDEIWDDDYLGTAPNGRVVSKADLMAAVNDNVIQIQSLEPDDLHVRVFGDVAVKRSEACDHADLFSPSLGLGRPSHDRFKFQFRSPITWIYRLEAHQGLKNTF